MGEKKISVHHQSSIYSGEREAWDKSLDTIRSRWQNWRTNKQIGWENNEFVNKRTTPKFKLSVKVLEAASLKPN